MTAGVQGIMSEAAGVQAANAGPVLDERFTQYETVDMLILDFPLIA